MSRIGKMPIKIQAGVKVDIKGQSVKVEGPKGKLSHELPHGIVAKADKENITISVGENADVKGQALWGLSRTLVYNMVHGVSQGFTKELDIVGVGYRASMKGQVLSMTLGYSHPVDFTLPQGIAGKVDANTHITVTGADKELVGRVAAKIRGFKEPEPYQGNGVRYTNETIIRKQGKA
ncbi:MAG: 50S ribosomal protein L6, partial [Proteobacteria bacterium]